MKQKTASLENFGSSGLGWYDYLYQKIHPELVQKDYELSGVCDLNQFYGMANFRSMFYSARQQMPNKIFKVIKVGTNLMILTRTPQIFTNTIFWITNGVDIDDDYRVVTQSTKLIRCSHCFSVRNGFGYIGDKKYAICNNCLYRPSKELLVLNFIRISKKKNPKEFNTYLQECENKTEYERLKQ